MRLRPLGLGVKNADDRFPFPFAQSETFVSRLFHPLRCTITLTRCTSQFFSTWQFPLPQAIETTPLPKVTIKALSDTYDDSTDLRSLRLGVSHRGLIWPTLAFSANITSWPFNSPPPVNHVRHHLKGASDHGFEEYEVAFTVVGRETFWVDWTAVVENGIWKSYVSLPPYSLSRSLLALSSAFACLR